MKKIQKKLMEAYRSTNYCVTEGRKFAMRIGHISEDAKELLSNHSAGGAIFITAWNPFGEVLGETKNCEANSALKKELEADGFVILSGSGVSLDSRWHEDSFFAFPVCEDEAKELCSRYEQNAVVFVDSSGMPSLITY